MRFFVFIAGIYQLKPPQKMDSRFSTFDSFHTIHDEATRTIVIATLPDLQFLDRHSLNLENVQNIAKNVRTKLVQLFTTTAKLLKL